MQNLVDTLYERFSGSLPGELQGDARRLAHLLDLAPEGVLWSEVFGHEVTLAAPLLVADAMPSIPSTLVEAALEAHLLAVIGAFGMDRVADGQVNATPALSRVLEHVHAARDRALERLRLGREWTFAEADRRTAASIAIERDLLRARTAVAFARYEEVSLGKQQVGLPASLALAAAAGWDLRRRRALTSLLEGIWMGLQHHDDVTDWEDDFARGGAWAFALARHALEHEARARDRRTLPSSPKTAVLASSVLARMLRRATMRYRAARRLANALGAVRLARWTRERELALEKLAAAEAESPGFVLRERVLRPFVEGAMR